MAGWTNLGKQRILGERFRGDTPPTNYFVALIRSTSVPSATTTTLGTLTQISTGTGYDAGGVRTANGYQLTPNSTDFDTETTDSNNRGVQIKDVAWTAAGGNLDSGAGARYAVLTDDNATAGSREVLYYWDLGSDRNVSDTQTLTLQDCEIKINE